MNRQRFIALIFVLPLVVTGCMQSINPVATISANRTTGYPPLVVTFDGSSSQGVESSIASYAWDFDDGGSAETAIVSHVFEERGVHEVSLTVVDGSGLIASTTVVIQVLNRIPHAAFRISPFGAPRDYPVQFDASESADADGEIVSYLWDFGDGETGEGMTTEHIFPRQQTEYLVTLTVIDDDGAANHAIRTVVVLGCDTCG